MSAECVVSFVFLVCMMEVRVLYMKRCLKECKEENIYICGCLINESLSIAGGFGDQES